MIFVVYMDGDEEGMAEKSVANVTGNEALSSLTAVKNGDVYAIPLGDMYTSAMRTADGLEIFCQRTVSGTGKVGTDDETKIFTGNRADKKHPALSFDLCRAVGGAGGFRALGGYLWHR